MINLDSGVSKDAFKCFLIYTFMSNGIPENLFLTENRYRLEHMGCESSYRELMLREFRWKSERRFEV